MAERAPRVYNRAMYLPAQFDEKRREIAFDLMQEHPLATLVTVQGGRAEADACPLLVERAADGGLTLRGHLARSNPKIALMAEGAEVLAIFHGPEAYVSPTWYRPGLHVPTWNYAVVQASGPSRLIEDGAELEALLVRLTERFEGGGWRPDFGEAGMTGLARAIAGFEIRVEKLESKLKLSQNRETEDRDRVRERLLESPDPRAAAVGRLMRKVAEWKP